MDLTERDIGCLLELSEVGLLDTLLIWHRHYTPTDAGLRYCQRRLRQFADASLVEAIQPPYNVKSKFKKICTFYRLTPEGADVLYEATGREAARTGRSDPPGTNTLLHRLGCVRFRLCFDEACHEANISTTWTMEQDRYPNSQRHFPKRRQFLLYESWEAKGRRISVYPDAAVLLELPSDRPSHILAIIEYDRSTETHKQLLEKATGLARYLSPTDRPYRAIWPQLADNHAPRILFVCPSPERQRNIAETFADSRIAPLIRIASESDLSPQTAVREAVWMDTQGNRKAIWPRQ